MPDVSASNADHNVKYNVKADFTSLIVQARKAREELRALKREEDANTKSSLDNQKKIDAAHTKALKDLKDHTAAQKIDNTESLKGQTQALKNLKELTTAQKLYNAEVSKSSGKSNNTVDSSGLKTLKDLTAARKAYSEETSRGASADDRDTAAQARKQRAISELVPMLNLMAAKQREAARAADEHSSSSDRLTNAHYSFVKASDQTNGRLGSLVTNHAAAARAAEEDAAAQSRSAEGQTRVGTASKDAAGHLYELSTAHKENRKSTEESTTSTNRHGAAVGSLGRDLEGIGRKVDNVSNVLKRNNNDWNNSSSSYAHAAKGLNEFGNSVTAIVSKLGLIPGAISLAVSSAGPLVSILGSLGAGALGLVSSLGSLASSAGALPGAFVAAGASFGVFKAAITPVMGALKTFATTQSSAGQSAKAMASENAKLQEQLAKLSPAAREVTLALADMSKIWKDQISKNVQQSLFAPVVSQLGNLKSLMPVVNDLLTKAATAIGTVASEGIKMLSSGPWKSDFGELAKANVHIIENMGSALLHVLDGFRNLTVAAIPFTRLITEDIKRGAVNFDAFMTSARQTGQLAEMFNKVHERAKLVWDIIKNLAYSLTNIGKASTGFGDGLLKSLDNIITKFRDLTSHMNDSGSAFKVFMTGMKPVLHEVALLLGAIGQELGKAFSNTGSMQSAVTLLQTLRTTVLPAVVQLFKNLQATGLAEQVFRALADILNRIGVFFQQSSGVAKTFVSTLKLFADVLLNIINAVPAPVLNAIGTALGVIGAAVTVAKLSGLLKLVEILPSLVSHLQSVGGAVSSFVSSITQLNSGMEKTNNAFGGFSASVAKSNSAIGDAAAKWTIANNAIEKTGHVVAQSSTGIAQAGSTWKIASQDLEKVGTSFQAAGNHTTTFGEKVKSVATGAFSSFKAGLSGIVSALGGPWAIAIAAAAIGISLLINKLGQASRAEEEHKQAVEAVTNSINQYNEAIGNVDPNTFAKLVSSNPGLKELDEHLKRIGVSAKQFQDALGGDKQALQEVDDAYQKQINTVIAARDANQHWMDGQDQANKILLSTNRGIQRKIEIQQADINSLQAEKDAIDQKIRIENAVQDAMRQGVLAQTNLTSAQRETLASSESLGSKYKDLTNLQFELASSTSTSAEKASAFQKVIEGIKTVPEADQLNVLTTAAGELSQAHVDAGEKAKQFQSIMKAISDSSASDTDKYKALGNVFHDIAGATLDAADKANLLQQAWDKLHQPAIDAAEATDKMFTSQANLKDQLQKTGGELVQQANDSKENTDATSENIHALEGAYEASSKKYLLDLSVSKDASKTLQEYRDRNNAISSEAEANGANADEVQKIADRYKDVPTDPKYVSILANTQAAQQAIDQIRVGQFIVAHPGASNADALAAIQAGNLNEAVGKSRDSVVNPSKPGEAKNNLKKATKGYATGGQVTGPGSSTSDSVPAMLSAGEYVHNASAVAYYGSDRMAAINNKTAPKFATGGLVGSAPQRLASGGMVSKDGSGPQRLAGGGGVQGDPINLNFTVSFDSAIAGLNNFKAELERTFNGVYDQFRQMWGNVQQLSIGAYDDIWVQIGHHGTQLAGTFNDIYQQFVHLWGNIQQVSIAAYNDIWTQIGKGGTQLGPTMNDIYHQFVQMWGNVQQVSLQAYADIWVQIGNAGSQLAPTLNDVYSQFVAMWGAIQQVSLQAYADLWVQLGNAGSQLGPMLNDVYAQFVAMWGAVQAVSLQAYSDLWVQLGNAGSQLGPITNDVYSQFVGMWSAIQIVSLQAYGDLWVQIANAGVNIQSTTDAVYGTFVAMWQAVTAVSLQLYADMWAQIAATPVSLQGLFDSLYASFVAFWQGVTDVSVQLWSQLWSTILDVWNQYASAQNGAWNEFYNATISDWQSFEAKLFADWSSLWDNMFNRWQDYASQQNNAFNEFYNATIQDWQQMEQTLQQSWDDNWNKIKDSTQHGMEDVLGILNQGIDAINGVLTKVGMSFQIPHADFGSGSATGGHDGGAPATAPAADGSTPSPTTPVVTVADGGLIEPLRRALGGPAAVQSKIENKPAGYIQGAGTTISDSIPAYLSTGEYVVKASAVQKIGVDNLNKMNSSGDISFIRGDMGGMTIKAKHQVALPHGDMKPFTKGYAEGGLVDWSKAQHLAGGGAAGLPQAAAAADAGMQAKLDGIKSWIHAQAGKPYVMGAAGPDAYDCSGLVGAVLKLTEGQSPYGRIFSTPDEAGFFDKGFGGVNDLNAGWQGGGGGDGHTTGSIAGLDFEATPPHVLVGSIQMPPGAFPNQGHHVVGSGTQYHSSGGGGVPMNPFMAKGVDYVMNQMIKPVVADFQGKMPMTGMGQIGSGALGKIGEGLRAKVQQAYDEQLAASAGGGGGGGGGGRAGADKWKDMVAQALQMLGMPASDLEAVLNLIGRESGGNPGAVNRTDTNAQQGHPSQGLMQTIQSTFDAHKAPGHDNILDPLSNILAGLGYIKARYGGNIPTTAYASGGFVEGKWVPDMGIGKYDDVSKQDDGFMSNMSFGNLGKYDVPAWQGGPSKSSLNQAAKEVSSYTNSESVVNESAMNFGDINITNPKPEVAGDSLHRTITKLSATGGRK